MQGRRVEPSQFAAAVCVVVVAACAIILGSAESTSVQAARVVATPTVAPVWTPAPAARPGTDECPAMTNPGGGIDWRPVRAPGPHTTGGSVSLDKFGIRAPIKRVGFGGSGMVIPHNARDIAWLDQGGFPGRTNNAVLAGHIRYSGVNGSFNRIKELGPGDTVEVALDGKTWTFRVVWTCAFPFQTKDAGRIMGNTLVPSVTLITCGGTFSRAAGTHNKRIVVRAELVQTA